MNFTEQETAVLDFYRRENQGVIESEALAGLSLNTFRAARSRLVRARRARRHREGPVRAGRGGDGMSVQDTEFDREIAKLLRPAGVPPVDEWTMRIGGPAGVPPVDEFLEGDNPAAEWTRVLALYWRLDHEYPGLLDEKAMPVMCIERGWLSLEPDGPIRQPTHDGSVRRYRITEAGRVAASAVLP
jgi:hypothetical protein